MDINNHHHKFTNSMSITTCSWDNSSINVMQHQLPYNMMMMSTSSTTATTSATISHPFLHHENPFDQWPTYYQNSSSSSTGYLPTPSNSSHNYHLLSINQQPADHDGVPKDDHNQEVMEDHEQHEEDDDEEELGAMKEMMFKIAAMQPVDIDPATIRKPRRRNVRISDDPQSVAARHRRERISEKVRILQRLVPGGTKMDTATMLDEAIRYVKFLKRQIRTLQANQNPTPGNNQAAYSLLGGGGGNDPHHHNDHMAAGDISNPMFFNHHN